MTPSYFLITTNPRKSPLELSSALETAPGARVVKCTEFEGLIVATHQSYQVEVDGQEVKLLDLFDIKNFNLSYCLSSQELKVSLPWPGHAHLFIQVYEGHLFLSSELRALDQLLGSTPVSYDTQSLKSFLQTGFVPKRETLRADIKMAVAGDHLTWSRGKLTHKKFCDEGPIEDKRPDEYEVYESYLVGLGRLRSKLSMMTLTGGSDSRLSFLSLVRDYQRNPLTCWFDPVGLTDEVEFNCEVEAIEALLERYPTPLIYAYPEEDRFHQIFKNSSRQIKNHPWDFDSHLQSLTGIYGTELLGGGALELDLEQRLADQEIQDCLVWSGEEHKHLSELLNLKTLAQYYDYVTFSYCTDLYKSHVWVHPWLQAQRKPTPFLQPEFLACFFQLDPEDVRQYRMMRKIFDHYFPDELQRYPLHSSMIYAYPDICRTTGKVKYPLIKREQEVHQTRQEEILAIVGKLLDLKVLSRADGHAPKLSYRLMLLSHLL